MCGSYIFSYLYKLKPCLSDNNGMKRANEMTAIQFDEPSYKILGKYEKEFQSKKRQTVWRCRKTILQKHFCLSLMWIFIFVLLCICTCQ